MRPALQNGQHIPTLAVILIWAANVVTVWSHRIRTRRSLTHLDDHMLKDIGLDRAQAEHESIKRFWMP